MPEQTTTEWGRLSEWLPGMIARSPDPEAAAGGLRRFWAVAGPALRAALEADPPLLEVLLTLFANSEFLAEALVQTPDLLLWLERARRENNGRTRDEWSRELAEFSAGVPRAERSLGLARFKRREYLRIVWRDLQGLASLAETTAELSQLADAILEQAYTWAWNDLASRFGTPQSGQAVGAELAVLGLGKLGGLELNYSSDIDLMFLYSEAGETAGGVGATSNREYFTRLAQAITEYVSAMTAEGPTYRVDLRLRPGGREGEVAISLKAASEYYHRQARDWELQMLIRARACAGSRVLAHQFLDGIQSRVYPLSPVAAAVADGVRLSRQRISTQLEHHRAVGRRRPELDVKLDAGGIRDIEFLVQFLQRLYGGAELWIRSGNTLQAMQRLHDKRRLGLAEFQRLSSAYWLLRQIEHRLQLRLGQQTHTLPAQPERLWILARSLRQAEGGRLAADAGSWLSEASMGVARQQTLAVELVEEIERRMAAVRDLYLIYLGENGVFPAGVGADAPAGSVGPKANPRGPEPRPEMLWRGDVDLTRHGQRQWQRLVRSVATLPEAETALAALSPAGKRRLQLALEHSDWMLETLLRRPGLIVHLDDSAETAAGGPELASDFSAGMAVLREWRQRETLRLLAEEWETRPPLSVILHSHTATAERVLTAALELARRAAPVAPTLAVLGLGRLGLGELDLLSDVDLVFVASEAEREPAARLAAKFIEALTAYTQSGSLYAVDTRLRPGGGEGELIQTPASLSVYFERQAGVWEAFSYLKARRVAGCDETAAQALGAVKEHCRHRFSGAGIARTELAALRDRMERAGRPGRWGLKTPPGGYYDVDFLVSRLWLQAGLWPQAELGLGGAARALAPELLPEATASALGKACERLRMADHALRAATGKAGSAIPASGDAIERAGEWLAHGCADADGDVPGWVSAACQQIRRIYHDSLHEG